MLFNNDTINSIRDEWKVFIFDTDDHAMLLELPDNLQIDEYWRGIFDVKNAAKKLKYKNLSTLIKIVFILLDGNSDLERVFH